MSMNWVHESTPTWDDAKEKIIGKAPEGIFRLDNYRGGDMIPGDSFSDISAAVIPSG